MQGSVQQPLLMPDLALKHARQLRPDMLDRCHQGRITLDSAMREALQHRLYFDAHFHRKSETRPQITGFGQLCMPSIHRGQVIAPRRHSGVHSTESQATA
jgi:hypothetical protein